MEKLSEIYIIKDGLSFSVLSGHGESVSSVTSDRQRIPRYNNKRKNSDTFITGGGSIQEPVNPSKRVK